MHHSVARYFGTLKRYVLRDVEAEIACILEVMFNLGERKLGCAGK